MHFPGPRTPRPGYWGHSLTLASIIIPHEVRCSGVRKPDMVIRFRAVSRRSAGFARLHRPPTAPAGPAPAGPVPAPAAAPPPAAAAPPPGRGGPAPGRRPGPGGRRPGRRLGPGPDVSRPAGGAVSARSATTAGRRAGVGRVAGRAGIGVPSSSSCRAGPTSSARPKIELYQPGPWIELPAGRPTRVSRRAASVDAHRIPTTRIKYRRHVRAG